MRGGKKYVEQVMCCGDCGHNRGYSSSPSDRKCHTNMWGPPNFSIEDYLVKGIHPDCPLEDWE